MESLYNTVRRVVETKRATKQEPAIALFRELDDIIPGQRSAWEPILYRLRDIGRLHIGPTIRDSYARPVELRIVADEAVHTELLNWGKSPVLFITLKTQNYDET